MVHEKLKVPIASRPFHLRKLTKAGKSRYLSIGKIIPEDWIAVKVYVEYRGSDVINLHLVKIQ